MPSGHRRAIGITDCERRQMAAIRQELDQGYEAKKRPRVKTLSRGPPIQIIQQF